MMDEKDDEEYPRRGEIWFVETPNQPDDPHQPRPALIVSGNIRNRLTNDVIVVPIFSRGRLGPTHIALQTGASGLANASVLFCEEVTTVHRDFVLDGPFGRPVSHAVLDRVVRVIRRAVGEVVPEPSS